MHEYNTRPPAEIHGGEPKCRLELDVCLLANTRFTLGDPGWLMQKGYMAGQAMILIRERIVT